MRLFTALDLSDDVMGKLETTLTRLRPTARDPIPVHVRDLGAFLNPKKPRIFWCGIDAPGLEALPADTEAATTALGIRREERAYSPHLTLARIDGAMGDKPQTLAGFPDWEIYYSHPQATWAGTAGSPTRLGH